MRWKNLPIWLKGGLIGLSIGILWNIFWYWLAFWRGGSIPFFNTLFDILGDKSFLYFAYSIHILALPFSPYLMQYLGVPHLNTFLINFFSTLNLFLIGCLIGWLVGKIKSKKPKI